MEKKSNDHIEYRLQNDKRTPGWDHFNEHFLAQSIGNLNDEDKTRYKNIGDRFLGYDVDNIENIIKEDAVLLSSTGKKIELNDEYHLKQLLMCIQNVLDIKDITPDELKLLEKSADTTNKDLLYKWILLQ